MSAVVTVTVTGRINPKASLPCNQHILLSDACNVLYIDKTVSCWRDAGRYWQDTKVVIDDTGRVGINNWQLVMLIRWGIICLETQVCIHRGFVSDDTGGC